MLDWNKVKNDKTLLKKVEKMVDDASLIHYDFPDDIRDELNHLTGNEWSGDDYINYCSEYWESLYSLEAVVYALFHDGEYPHIVENKLNFIRPHDKSVYRRVKSAMIYVPQNPTTAIAGSSIRFLLTKRKNGLQSVLRTGKKMPG